jgi:YHS domain-containing protein
MKSTAQHDSKALDPVCGAPIDTEKSDFLRELDNRTYYFCTDRCRNKFNTNPDKYIKGPLPPKTRKGWWGRYLDRVQKATGGSPPKCCQ